MCLHTCLRARRLLAGAAALLALTGCAHLGLLRPNTLKQLNPRVARLVNELPRVDHPNEDIVGRLFAHGGPAHAKRAKDGVMRAKIRVPPNQFIWEPAIIVMPQAGDLELEFQNEDQALHMAFLPSNGGREVVELPPCNQYTLQGDAFSRAVTGEEALEWSTSDAVLNMRVIDAFFRSARSNTWERP